MIAWPFILSLIYLTLLVSFIITLLEQNFSAKLIGKTFRRWGKFLLLLGCLAIFILILSFLKDTL